MPEPKPCPPPGVRVELGTLQQMLPLTSNPDYRLGASMVEQAFELDHQVVITHLNDELVAYGWVAYTPTPHINGWWVEFAPGHRYNYHSYTLPEFRGRHLRGSFGVLQAPDKQRDVTHSIAFIALHNQASMRAEQRNGGERVGYAGYAEIGPFRWSFRTPGARAFGFQFRFHGNS